MNRAEIKTFIPHREPMLLLDEVFIDREGLAHGFYTVRGDEFFLQGHFPGNPIVPGVILCEMMAQTCSILFAERCKGKTPYFTSMNKVRFKQVVRPKDKIEFTCSLLNEKHAFYFAEGKGRVGDKRCVSGEFSFTLVASE